MGLHTILLDPVERDRIYVAISAAGVFRTDDAGRTWRPVNRGLKSQYIPDPNAEVGYCLGRQSYIVGACLEWLRMTWPQFTTNTRHVITRDIVEALADGRAGSEAIDVPGWRDALVWMIASFEEGIRQDFRGALSYRKATAEVLAAAWPA